MKTIGDEVSHRHLSNAEIIRFIYDYCCNYFSFDVRWFYANNFADNELTKQIRNQKYDLENITTDLVICHTMIREIIKPLVEYFTSGNVVTKVGGGSSHADLQVYDKSDFYCLDPTLEDLQRVKLGIMPTNYSSYNSISELREMDKSFGFNLGTDDDIKAKIFDGMDMDDYVENMSYILSKTPANKHFVDAYYMIKEYFYFHPSRTSTFVSPDYDIHKLFFDDKTKKIYELSKEYGVYDIKETSPQREQEIQSEKKYIRI